MVRFFCRGGLRSVGAVLALGVVLLVAGCQGPGVSGSGESRSDETEEKIEIAAVPGSETDEAIVIEVAGDETDETAGDEDESEAVLDDGVIRLLFGGDVLLSEHVLQAYRNGGGIGGVLDPGYREVIGTADFFMVNQEFPFSNRGTAAADKQYTFRLAPEYVSLLREMGIDGVTLANNHALDFGTDALLDTCTTLDDAGIAYTGAGADLEQAKRAVIFEQDGVRFGVIGATRVIPDAGWAAGQNHVGMLSTYDPAVLLKEIEALKASCDYMIVYVHWGIERDEKPQEYQRQLGRQYIDAGADLVIGSHPHVLQGIEYYKGKPVVYSLGNFVFGSSIPKTMLLSVEFDEGNAEPVLHLVPGTSGAGYTRQLTKPDKLQAFYRYMESISFGVSLDEDGMVYQGE